MHLCVHANGCLGYAQVSAEIPIHRFIDSDVRMCATNKYKLGKSWLVSKCSSTILHTE